jgi:hypothetical protein
MSDQPIILPDSPEAARIETVTGWVSRNGRFYGIDEHLARYDGSTHVPCSDCGAPTEKGWTKCADCRAKHEAEREAKRPRQVWDGETPLFHEGSERFIFDGDVDELCEDEEKSFNEMEFVLCEPEYAREIEADDFSDDLPDNDSGMAPEKLTAAIEAFNAAMKGVVLCWRPTDIVAIEKEKTQP